MVMTGATLRIEPGGATIDEILDRLDAGVRVIVTRELLGASHEVALRYDGETYYCDTPTTLHRHRTEAGMRACLERQGYGRGRVEAPVEGGRAGGGP